MKSLPPHPAGRLEQSGGTSPTGSQNQFTYVAAPTVTSISPASGPILGGTSVILTGTDFTAATAVTFGSAPATGFTVNSATQITATAPSGSAGSVNIRVTTAGGTSATAAGNQFTYVAAPTVTSIAPTSGPTSGGTTVILTGTGFTGATAVTFGSAPATGFTVNSATQITATAPSGSAGVVDIQVTTRGGTSATGGQSQFTYALPQLSVADKNFFERNATGGFLITLSAPAGPGGVSFDIATSDGTATEGTDYPSIPLQTVSIPAGSSSFAIAYSPLLDLLDEDNETFYLDITNAVGATISRGRATATIIDDDLPPLASINDVSQVEGNGTSSIVFTVTLSQISGKNVNIGYQTADRTALQGSDYVASTGAIVINAGQSSGTISVPLIGDNLIEGDESFVVNLSAAVSDGQGLATIVNDDQATDISPSSILGAVIGVNYSQTLMGTGGTDPFTYVLSAGSLPAGISLSGSGVISGTPSAGGIYTFSVSATDSSTAAFGGPFTVTRAYTLVVAAPTISLLPATLTATELGQAYSQSITASGGTAPYSFAVTAGALPTGMTLNAVGLLSGTPTAAGTFNFTVTATDASTGAGPYNGSQAYTLNVSMPQTPPTVIVPLNGSIINDNTPTITGTAQANSIVAIYIDGVAAGTVFADSAGNWSFTSSSLSQGSHTVYANLTDGQGTQGPNSSTNAFTIDSVAPAAPVIVTPASGSSRLASLRTVSGSAEALSRITVYLDGNADGTTTSDSGGNWTYTLSPLALGVYTVRARSSDAVDNLSVDSATNSFTVVADLAVTPGAVSGASVGGSFSQSNPASGGTAPYSYSLAAGALPAGTTLSASTGMVSGIPTTAGAFSYAIQATDSQGVPATTTGATVSGTIAQATQTISFTSTAPVGAVISGAPYTPSAISTSGLTVSFVIDASSSGVCSISGGAVSFIGTGTCRVNVDQTGNANFAAASQVQQSFAVGANAPSASDLTGVAVTYGSSGTTIDLSGSVSGVASSIAVAAAPAHGTTSVAGNVVTYTPASGYYGADSFTFTATGPGGTSSPATVALTVATPTAPAVAARSGVAVAFNSQGTTIDLSSSVSGIASSIAVATAPAHGTTSVAGAVVIYTPASGYYGADSFTYTATGPGGTSSPASVALTVATPAAPVVAARSGVAVTYNTAATIDLSSSVSGVSTGISVVTAPTRGTTSVAGNVITYTPASGYYGADSFTFTATGPGGTSAPASVALTVATPPAPVVTAPSNVSVGYNSQGTAIDLSSSVSGVASSISVATAPAHGTTSVAGLVITYTPAAGYYGPDSFTYTATGPGGTSSPATVSLTVATPVAPVVAARSGVAVAFNSQGTAIDLSSSVSGVSTGISVVTSPARGTTRVAGNVVTYTPNIDTYGADSFTFTATGPGGTSAPATVSLTVAGSVPRVQPQSGSTSDGQMVSIELTRGAAIGPFTAAQVVSVIPANAATTSITSTGDGAARRYFLEATAAPRFGGTVSINYTLTNAFGVSPLGVVTLTVAARPDPSNDPKVRALTDAQLQATRRFGRSQIANFMRRNEQLHSGRARSSQNIRVNIVDPTRERRPQDSMAPAVMPKRDSDTPDVTEAHYAAPAAQDEKPAGVLGAMSMWVSGAIDIATRDASSFAPKLSATTQGISGGVDFQISKRTAIGFGAGYGNVTSNINAKAAELRATSNLVAVYGSTKLFENGFVDVVAGRGFLDYKTRRRIDGTELTALGSRTGTMNLAAVSFGFNQQVEDLDWSFYSKLEYMDAKLAAYTETSGGTRNNLRLSALDDTSYSAGLGFRLQKAFATGIGTVTPRLRSEFGREFGKANVQYVDYADIAGATSRGIQGRLNEQNFYQTSIGTMIDLKSDWSFDLEYALMYNTATLSSGIKVQLSRAF